MSSLAHRSSFENPELKSSFSTHKFFIRINEGSEKGAVFQLTAEEVLIGRDPSNHIQLKKDTKVSRQHVRLILTNGKYYVQDITKNNFIIINGIKLKQSELKGNEVIQIGDHTLQFLSSIIEKNKENLNSNINSNPKKNTFRIVLILGIVLGAAFFLMEPSAKPKTKTNLEVYENKGLTDRRIEDLDDSISKLDEEIKNKSTFSQSGQNITSIFIRGKRDFDRGQYFYSSESFRAVLALNPNHEDARRLLRLSDQYENNLIEEQFKEGITSRDVGRYEKCKATMKNIMNLINNPENARHREAQKILFDCDLKIQGGR